jgi:hypothetical protein
VELVSKIRKLNATIATDFGSMELKCSCGTMILPPTPVISHLKDRQRGLLKSRIRDHLHSVHGISDTTIRVVIGEAFPK